MPSNEIVGLRELQKQLAELGALDGGKVLRSATLLATTPVLRAARAKIPVNDRDYLAETYTGRKVSPGFAKRNIARKVILSRDKTRAVALVGVKPEAYYAVQFVELGTSRQPKQPWLAPAHRETEAQQVQAFGETVKRKIDQVARRRG